MLIRSGRRFRLPLVIGTAAATVLAGVVGASALDPAGASSAPAAYRPLHHAIAGNARVGTRLAAADLPRLLQDRAAQLPAGVPKHGSYAFLLQLKAASTLTVYRDHTARGRSVAASAAKRQFGLIKALQSRVIDALPTGSRTLYTTHSALAGVAVLTDVRNYAALTGIGDVAAIYPIAPKSASNSYAMPLQGAPAAWHATGGDLGQGTTIALIDTGIDYTHADFGGPGTTTAYTTAKALDKLKPTYPDPTKIVGGHDFAGDSYDASDPKHDKPAPDANPLDCSGHGTHVAGIAAGYGEYAGDGTHPAGSTFTGNYTTLPTDPTSYQPLFRIGPGMAPKAKILAYKIFGCGAEATTDLVGEAIEAAIDRNKDGVPSDHVGVINMSLGSDFSSPQDGDSQLANAASKAGITVVVASGNSGDQYDVGGSPGNASRAITVANSVDAASKVDALHVSAPASIEGDYGAERSVMFTKWATTDLTGSVAAVTQTGNADGCAAVTQDLTGEIALVTWRDAAPHCPSKTVADNLAAAHATGFILGSDAETFSAGINGDKTIPGVITTKSATAQITSALGLGQDVAIGGTSANGFDQLFPADNDELNDSSSRGDRGAGDVKPDVSAVGTSVFSAAMGSGNDGVSDTGTSMATPMVAGLAALVRSAHPNWTPEQVKADIMNTAGEDVYTGANHSGRVFAPNRVGAGRIQADAAVSNKVLAYVGSNPGAVSVSFGPVAVHGRTTLIKTVDVSNRAASLANFTVKYQALTSVPGVSYLVSPTSVSVPAGGIQKVTVKFVVTNPAALTKTHDATVATKVALDTDLALGTETLADASGRLLLTPKVGNSAGAQNQLRVPVYSAPRPASAMGEGRLLALSGSGAQRGALRLTGSGVNQGSGAAKVRSLVSGFELQATSGLAPTCAKTVVTNCVHFADERSADLKYVGTTSDYPRLRALGDPFAFGDTEAYFSITTQRPWRTPVGPQEFDIVLDTNRDGKPDAIVVNTSFPGTDVFESEMIDITSSNPANWFVRDDEYINDRFGNPSTLPGVGTVPGVDTALYDSDTMVLPIWVGALRACTVSACGVAFKALPGFTNTHTRMNYGVVSYGESDPVDHIGVNPTTLAMTSSHLTMDIKNPGIDVHNSSITNYPTSGLLLNTDAPGTSLTVRRNVTTYNRDRGKGLLLIHYQNLAGSKAKLVALKSVPRVSVKYADSSVSLGSSVTATVRVANTAGHTATGRVVLHRADGSVFRRGLLSRGTVSFTWRPGSTGRFTLYATYVGDANYVAGRSATVSYRVS